MKLRRIKKTMTFTQTIDIPVDRKITLEVPREVPTGKVNVIIQFPAERKKIGMTRKELDEFLKMPIRLSPIHC